MIDDRKGNNLTIFTEKTTNLGNLKEGTWENKQEFVLDQDVSRHFKTSKDHHPSDSKAKEPKYQTQIIRNVLRNLVRKKNSPKRKLKPAKSKNPEEENQSKKLSKKPSVKKTGPQSIASSKSRKLHKIFNRKNLSLSLENRNGVTTEMISNKIHLPFNNTIKNEPTFKQTQAHDYWSNSRPNTSKNRENSSGYDPSKAPSHLSLHNNKKLKLINPPILHKDTFKFTKRSKKD